MRPAPEIGACMRAINVGFLLHFCQGGFYPCMRGEAALLLSHTQLNNRPAVITRAPQKQLARTDAEGPRPFSSFEEADTPCSLALLARCKLHLAI